ncbi:related to ERG25 - C-4 methyl sterol oxidase [Ustilago trichophora]|uniref:Related to ERG25 - C-4 methyl sterol oxidase n=1 Tax=Ustilago trichophora TaxID=86804 RepID=A0A5C3EGB3_9BASI|nr:related to ERG25 - C-4 methyl sterol oxidase [Ustilago trichophora]
MSNSAVDPRRPCQVATKPQPESAEQAHRTVDATAAPKKHAMTSTWRRKHPKDWSFSERALVSLGLVPKLFTEADKSRPPVFAKDAPVPVYPLWKMHFFVAPKALAPLMLHASFAYLTGIQLGRAWVAPLYIVYFVIIGTRYVSWCNGTAAELGTFDGQAQRDAVPDVDTTRVMLELLSVALVRTGVAVPYLYDPLAPIFDIKTLLLLPINVFCYAVALDFYFYWYHRLMHEVNFLWPFHRKHHTTKHPTAAFGAFASHEQEFFDILVIPILAWLTWPIDFATWWVTMCYIVYVEAVGHSGIRAYFQVPTTWPLRYLGVELCVEDHDIHHRHGWKKSGNYGKQTRLWDALFGTMLPRIEGTLRNIDWDRS